MPNMTALTTFGWIVSWGIVVAAFFVEPRNRRPGSATAWLMLVVLLPYAGLVLFWLIGSPKLSRRRRAQQRTMDARIAAGIEVARHDATRARAFEIDVPARYEPFIRRSRATPSSCSPTTTRRSGA